MKISLIQPSRNNLKYLKWSYDSIRKNQGDHEVEICVADDFSNDGTWEWCQERMENDSNFKAIRNEGPTRLGHTILYDKLINEVATKDICMIYHADMYLCPGALDAIEKHIKEKTIVSLTRIEPPLHPPGPEKILQDFKTEPEEFDEQGLLDYIESRENTVETTEGIFAPWAFYKSDFQEIGGHDPLYAPQSKEDSDIFNRFQLNGVKFIQTWEGFVYHMTCRGSRFNPTLTTPGTNSSEWDAQNLRSTRNFIRKWGHFCKHDALMKPVIPPKYNIEIRLDNPNLNLVEALEPWCTSMYVENEDLVKEYIKKEQPNTKFDLNEKFRNLLTYPIVVRIDGNRFTQQDFQTIQQLTEIIKDSGSIGKFILGNLEITINEMNEIQNELIFIYTQYNGN